MAEKVTTMVLKVDLQCPCCYKKVKKTLCKFPQIRDQVYDEKGNTVTITVVCCSPEKIQDKLCCKGGKAIKSVTIKDKPKDAPKPKDAGDNKPKEAAKPKDAGDNKPKEAAKPKDADNKPKEAVKPKDAGDNKPKEVAKPQGAEKPKEAAKPKEAEKPKEAAKPKEAEKPKEAAKPKEGDKPKESKPDGAKAAAPGHDQPKMMQSYPVNGFPMIYPGPGQGYYEGHYGVPGYQFGTPPPPQPNYEGYNPGYGYDHGRGAHVTVTRADYYFSDENPQACSIM